MDGHLETRAIGPGEGSPGRRGYPSEVKAEAVELCRSSDKSIRDIANDLGVSPESLRRWISQHDVDVGKRRDMALFVRRPPEGLVLHSDRGCQFISFAFGRRCEEASIIPSRGWTGDAYDNSMVESFFGTLECELDRVCFKTKRGARMEFLDFIEGFHNTHRLQSPLGYCSPMEFEEEHTATMQLTRSESV